MFTLFPNLEAAQSYALEHGLRQRAVAYITRGNAERVQLLVFDHDAAYPTAGTQVPAGGLEGGETPIIAAVREAFEETGLEGLQPRTYLGSGLYQNGLLHQVWHFCWLEVIAPTRRGDRPVAPTAILPDAWQHRAEEGPNNEGYTFHHRFEPLETVVLHYDMDALLPILEQRMGLPITARASAIRPCAVCYVTRGVTDNLELLVFTGHPWGGVQVVAGGIDAGETALQAAQRELLEESGLRLEDGAYLGRHDYFVRLERLEAYEARHYYHFHVSHELLDTWVHTVSSGEADRGLEYQFYWVRVGNANLDWGLGEFLPLLEEREIHD